MILRVVVEKLWKIIQENVKDEKDDNDFYKFRVMPAGITPKAGNSLWGWVWYANDWAPLNDNGQPTPPNHQICAQYCVNIREEIHETLLQKKIKADNSVLSFSTRDEIRIGAKSSLKITCFQKKRRLRLGPGLGIGLGLGTHFFRSFLVHAHQMFTKIIFQHFKTTNVESVANNKRVLYGHDYFM